MAFCEDMPVLLMTLLADDLKATKTEENSSREELHLMITLQWRIVYPVCVF